ncbi:hypothetical protein, partial [Kistimonas scapharcae]|uniref:hypothetical protein n=1 Tax=Kistimonas scapharcae TaxID=1036133 RepID=UPI0031E82044
FRDWQILSNTPHAGCHVVCTGVFEYLPVAVSVGFINAHFPPALTGPPALHRYRDIPVATTNEHQQSHPQTPRNALNIAFAHSKSHVRFKKQGNDWLLTEYS